jgi:hypothetical protein
MQPKPQGRGYQLISIDEAQGQTKGVNTNEATPELNEKITELLSVYRERGKDAARERFSEMAKGAKHGEVIALRCAFHEALSKCYHKRA